MPARLRSLPAAIPKARSTSSEGITREPNVAADETAETLAMVTIRFSRLSASRRVVTNSRVTTENSIAESPSLSSNRAWQLSTKTRRQFLKALDAGSAARLQLATAGDSGIAAQKVFVLRLNGVPGEARYALQSP